MKPKNDAPFFLSKLNVVGVLPTSMPSTRIVAPAGSLEKNISCLVPSRIVAQPCSNIRMNSTHYNCEHYNYVCQMSINI